MEDGERYTLGLLMELRDLTREAADARYRRRIRDIADEAVTTVLEHGAGHPRGKYETERFEMARRFREKYGSAKPDSSEDANAAAYFIGVFDTVAALGATGLRRTVTQLILLLMFSIGAAFPFFAVSAVLVGLLKVIDDVPFWSSAFLLTAAMVAAGNVFFWLHQRWNYRKEIPDARLHPSVIERFEMSKVVRCDRVGPYRPGALKSHNECKQYYSPAVKKPKDANVET